MKSKKDNFKEITKGMKKVKYNKLMDVNRELHWRIGERVFVEKINKDNTFWIHCSFILPIDKEIEYVYFRNVGKGKIVGKKIILPKKEDINVKMNKMFFKLKGDFEE